MGALRSERQLKRSRIIGLHSCCYTSYKRGMKRSCQSCSFVESVQVGQPCIFSASSIMHSSVYYLFVTRYTRDLFTALTRHLGSSITCFYPLPSTKRKYRFINIVTLWKLFCSLFVSIKISNCYNYIFSNKTIYKDV